MADHLNRLARLSAQEAEAISPLPDAVQLMTIHGSKGLEFPVVIIADVLRQGGGRTPPVRFDVEQGVALRLPLLEGDAPEWTALETLAKEQEGSEAERVAYVAFTRAADLLILSATGGDKGKAQERFAAFVASLPEEGVERQYLTPQDVVPVAPLPLRLDGARLILEVRTGPGVVLPGSLPVTSLGTYLQCPRMFAYRHLEGRLPLAQLWSERQAEEASNPERRAAGRQIGDAVHRALEHGWTAKDMQERLPYFSEPDLKTVIGLVQAMEGETYAPLHGRTFERERPLQVTIGPVTFEGIVDAYDREQRLVLDYKTDREVHPEDHLPQLALYAHHLGAREAALAYLRHKRLHLFGPEDLARGLDTVHAAVTRLTALDFSPTPDPVTCKRCAFKGVCDAAIRASP